MNKKIDPWKLKELSQRPTKDEVRSTIERAQMEENSKEPYSLNAMNVEEVPAQWMKQKDASPGTEKWRPKGSRKVRVEKKGSRDPLALFARNMKYGKTFVLSVRKPISIEEIQFRIHQVLGKGDW